jgi:pilus assembly protein Flp/PilA
MKEILTGKRGQGLVEYALILVLVAAVVVGVLTILGTSVSNILQQAADALDTSPKSAPEKDCYGSLLLPYLVGLTLLLSLLFRLLPQRLHAIAA